MALSRFRRAPADWWQQRLAGCGGIVIVAKLPAAPTCAAVDGVSLDQWETAEPPDTAAL